MQRNVWGRLLFPARALPGVKLECAGSLRFEVATPRGEDGESFRRLSSPLERVVPPRTGRPGCRGWLRPLGISSGDSGTPRRRSVSQDKALLGVATGRCQVGENTGYKMHLRWGRETKPQEKSGWHGGPACPGGTCWDWAWSEAQRITWEPPEDVSKPSVTSPDPVPPGAPFHLLWSTLKLAPPPPNCSWGERGSQQARD